ncbi:hypothetical protein GCM10020366_50260 [Saccharopolyspora gregorii]|uniref:Uncharacterized protein n=1 Tax=Saccharopolyspora gregorii TaxID=33914 RepID=A0ABP6RX22_9PSEU
MGAVGEIRWAPFAGSNLADAGGGGGGAGLLAPPPVHDARSIPTNATTTAGTARDDAPRTLPTELRHSFMRDCPFDPIPTSA